MHNMHTMSPHYPERAPMQLAGSDFSGSPGYIGYPMHLAGNMSDEASESPTDSNYLSLPRFSRARSIGMNDLNRAVSPAMSMTTANDSPSNHISDNSDVSSSRYQGTFPMASRGRAFLSVSQFASKYKLDS